jgi:SNF family Na+-dependent transporter
MRDKPPDWGK